MQKKSEVNQKKNDFDQIVFSNEIFTFLKWLWKNLESLCKN